jgi:hypothetical protein
VVKTCGDSGRIDRLDAQQYALIIGAATLFSKTPTIEDANFKLKEIALSKGANAVINVEYERGISATSWKIAQGERNSDFC